MHEMSLALEILSIVKSTARQNNAGSVTDISVEVGSLAGVMIPSLEFCLEAAKKGTCAQEADIHIFEIPGRGECPQCGRSYHMELFYSPCPECGEGYLRMIAGDELRVREIEVEGQI